MSGVAFSGGGQFATSRRGAMTQWEINRAFALRGERHSVQSISRILGRPQSDVADVFNTKAQAIAPPPPVTRLSLRAEALEQRDALVTKLWLAGEPIRVIQKRLGGVSDNTVHHIRVRLGLPSRKRP